MLANTAFAYCGLSHAPSCWPDYHLEQARDGIIMRLGGKAMIKKSLYEELTIHIDKEELAQLLGADPGFSVENVEEEKGEFHFMLSRKTTLDEAGFNPQAGQTQAERGRFL
jgi:hypothetical protein